MHYFGNPRYTQSMIAYYMILTEYFVEILLKNSIVGMLLTCPIRLHVPGPGYVVNCLLTCYLLFINLKLCRIIFAVYMAAMPLVKGRRLTL